MQQILNKTQNLFFERFGRKPAWVVSAPGRVNLIGEHTDYNDGFVFPMAIERLTVIAAAPSPADESVVYSVNKKQTAHVRIDGLSEPPQKTVWSGYVQGTLQYMVEAGLKPKPFCAVINSDVPLGGGLSSSASLEVATATLMEAMTGQTLDPVQKALICQKAEHHYAKMPCGIMDQFIAAMGQAGCAMLLDCRSKKPEMIPFDDPAVSVLIVNSNVKHELTGSEYPDRRRQCEKAAGLLGLSVLRDATAAALENARSRFGTEPDGGICFRRAKHVITENDRTTAMAAALSKKDWTACGQLMGASHESMKTDFEITCPEIDILVNIAQTTDGVIGSRMTGGGFGGCTVSLIETAKTEEILNTIEKRYKTETGIFPSAFVTRPAQGASIVVP
ncbi:MAG: galactokinase [Planctomycetaceae bacterium]|jgi:galactokinase|nr:galactokinase [Planctomycetaceae bacterium]